MIHHWTWDEDGMPSKKVAYFKPYIYVGTADIHKADAWGIDNMPLVKKSFETEWEKTEFLKKNKQKVYFNLPPTQQYLLEHYYQDDIEKLTQHPLRIFFYDIEVISDEFPNAIESKFPITSITIYDNLTKKYYVWGINRYDEYSCKDHLTGIEPEDIVYEFCKTEKDLLTSFLSFWRRNFPDLLTGYNSASFDLPYIVGRIEKVLGEGKSSKLSPVDNIFGSTKQSKFGQQYTEYNIGGISHIDYMLLYKTFTPGERESDSLDYVCQEELNSGKLEYGNMSLTELCRKDWNRFVNYNIWDVKLLVMLDEKRRYLDIAKFSAFSGFCNIDKALGKVAIITGVLAKQSMKNNKIIFTPDEGEKETIPGGYVKLPEPGMYMDCISVDLNSLYPNTIITLNISPETKIAKVVATTDTHRTVYFFKKKKSIEITKEKLREVLKEKNWSMSASGVIFNQNVKGVCAEFVDGLYQKRKDVKNKMLKLKASGNYDKKEVDRLDTEQYLYKILLNSTYGVLANRFFCLYDIDCAKSITTTGQALIKHSEQKINEFINTEWGLEGEHVLAADTDSAYFSITEILKKTNAKLIDENKNPTPECKIIENKIVTDINQKVQIWAKEKLNSADCRFEFKRENICPKVIWVGKKHYILYIIDSEGVKTDKIKYSGLSVVKATYSNEVKDITKSIVRNIMVSASREEADALFMTAYENFHNMPLNQMATRSSIKVMDKWKSLTGTGFFAEKGCPRHVKYSLYYNHLIQTLGLANKYSRIENGNKVKLLYLLPNKYNITGIAYVDDFPPEFDLEPDISTMFEKCVIKCITPIYEALKWKIPDPKMQHVASLESIFGGG